MVIFLRGIIRQKIYLSNWPFSGLQILSPPSCSVFFWSFFPDEKSQGDLPPSVQSYLPFILEKGPPIPQSFLPSRVNAEFPLPVYFWVIAVETLQDGWVECGELIIKADMTVLNQKHILSLVFVSKRERKMQ